MGISVQVRTFTGAVEATCVHSAFAVLCGRAVSKNLPLLGFVDPYDDSVFNRSQLRGLVPELRALAEDAAAEEAEAVQEILALVAQVERKAHRYLVFNGD
ncbi:hypothetical protein Sgleb_48250 [Streptomyces glebosus]|uniref:Uncharacterized protein n=1 Tax=Streptomyces glebosus TaxID=249580 RepID=A0A640T0E5_9ACTN|nr:hypothetical protein [Streptomyces glebosus]GFE16778.1 hypothetical protein Sgleb_48250 [Streptomyces glebosus]GHG81810.1 hypothetical protein GCM10010513_60620 [Streptomyces glebosus]